MLYHLVVAEAFGAYLRGDMIIDPAEVEAVSAGENSGHVSRVAAPAAEPTEHEGA